MIAKVPLGLHGVCQAHRGSASRKSTERRVVSRVEIGRAEVPRAKRNGVLASSAIHLKLGAAHSTHPTTSTTEDLSCGHRLSHHDLKGNDMIVNDEVVCRAGRANVDFRVDFRIRQDVYHGPRTSRTYEY